uniref:RRM domain-containing protein n=1 Tax=Mesocestoides corti TaxID=53468 RepID=A0A5K3FIE9_MESCO
MSFRRQPMDRVNPRYVPPSRHTIFIRGLPGSTNVDSVKNHFSEESKSKCTVEFFSTSEDKVRFSVAIRFKSHETAREMLEKYNGKELMGHPVEVTWFKDLKKARARVYEEQRHNRFRNIRGGFRGSHRGFSDRRGRGFSPNRTRDRSYSGGAPVGRRISGRPSVSSHSSSRSRSGSQSVSPKRRRLTRELGNGSAQGEENFTRMSQRRSRKSQSVSSSRSGSSSHSISNRSLSNRNKLSNRRGSFPDRGPAVPTSSHGLNSPINSRSSFSNAPAPTATVENEGSGLLSGLIQLKSKRLQSQASQRLDSSSHSNSATSRSSTRSPSPKRRHQRQKHNSPLSSGLFTKESKSPSPAKETMQPTLSGNNWRPVSYYEEPQQKQPAANSLFAAYGGKPAPGSGKIVLSPLNSERKAVDMDIAKSNSNSPRHLNASPPAIEKPKTKTQNKSWEEFVDQHEKAHSDKSPVENTTSVKDKYALIQEKKAAIEEEYKRDCETFATVVRTLIRLAMRVFAFSSVS